MSNHQQLCRQFLKLSCHQAGNGLMIGIWTRHLAVMLMVGFMLRMFKVYNGPGLLILRSLLAMRGKGDGSRVGNKCHLKSSRTYLLDS